jgi:hypothetical protein
MQVEVSGNWVYVYSGRTINEKHPNLTEVGYNDPFEVVHCIRLDKITGLKVDHVFEEMSVTIFAEGHVYPIRLTFGSRNCYRINCHGAAVCKLQDALGIPREFVWDMNKRSEQTALSVQRADERIEED